MLFICCFVLMLLFCDLYKPLSTVSRVCLWQDETCFPLTAHNFYLGSFFGLIYAGLTLVLSRVMLEICLLQVVMLCNGWCNLVLPRSFLFKRKHLHL